MKTVLFFDLDGTLMRNPFGTVIFPQVCDQIATQSGQSSEAVFEAILAEHDRRLANPLADRPRTMDWDDILNAVMKNYDLEWNQSIEALVIANAAPPHTATLDNATDVLNQLQAPHRRFIVASMGLAKYQMPVLNALGLAPFFDDFLMPDTTGYLKMDRAFYKSYYDDPNTLKIHVGDRYDHDCFFPQQFGAQSILRLPLIEFDAKDPFERSQELHARQEQLEGLTVPFETLPRAVITHLDELPAVVHRMELG